MKGKGLTMDVIVDAATALVQEKGYNNFSVRELALRLEVKAASLYNHVKSIDDINSEVGKLAAGRLNSALERATDGVERDRAIEALAYEYRSFVKNNYELYRAIIGLPALDQGGSLSDVGRDSINVIRNVVSQYEIPTDEAVHFSRCLRGVLHGFASLEMAGYYTGRKRNIPADDSFQFMVRGYIEWVNSLEEKSRE